MRPARRRLRRTRRAACRPSTRLVAGCAGRPASLSSNRSHPWMGPSRALPRRQRCAHSRNPRPPLAHSYARRGPPPRRVPLAPQPAYWATGLAGRRWTSHWSHLRPWMATSRASSSWWRRAHLRRTLGLPRRASPGLRRYLARTGLMLRCLPRGAGALPRELRPTLPLGAISISVLSCRHGLSPWRWCTPLLPPPLCAVSLRCWGWRARPPSPLRWRRCPRPLLRRWSRPDRPPPGHPLSPALGAPLPRSGHPPSLVARRPPARLLLTPWVPTTPPSTRSDLAPTGSRWGRHAAPPRT